MIKLTNMEHWLIEQARLSPNQIAIYTSDLRINYDKLLEQSLAAAEYLSSLGIKDGDNVCILSNHSYEFWIIVNALWLLGAVPVPLNTRNTIEEISWQIKHVDAKFIITFQPTQLVSNLKFVQHISLDDFDFQGNIIPNNLLHSSYYTLRSSLILFTSGSTGNPKAVVHTFKSLYESVKAMDSFFSLSSDDLWLSFLPLYHIGGFMILVRSLLSGCGVIFPNNLKHEAVIDAMAEFNPTHVSMVSTTVKRIIDDDTEPNANLKYVFLGGGPLSPEICSQAVDAGYPIVKVYGSTETCSMIAVLKSTDLYIRPDSAGFAITNEIKFNIKDEGANTEDTNGSTLGEVLISSPTLFKEYYNDQQSTQTKIVDGFYHTGDYGCLDEEGFLYIESRREDIIITGGENVSAKEVEEALLSFSGIQDKFVFGLENENWGQIVCAAIVCRNLSESEIKSQLKEKLAGFKIPKKFFFVEEIPRNEMGKIKRAELLRLLNLDEA
ncbi:MAG: O-succinylbenzoic acid--CoA ligase [Stygiobacter sp.]|nr:MAG: O-succinylbenzoic acid--CoA ligase [Stygiobacter sp.]KAF0211991.1 MAG: O-succinylbenzoic acid--CoA [Ignavibacteria bacterium]